MGTWLSQVYLLNTLYKSLITIYVGMWRWLILHKQYIDIHRHEIHIYIHILKFKQMEISNKTSIFRNQNGKKQRKFYGNTTSYKNSRLLVSISRQEKKCYWQFRTAYHNCKISSHIRKCISKTKIVEKQVSLFKNDLNVH